MLQEEEEVGEGVARVGVVVVEVGGRVVHLLHHLKSKKVPLLILPQPPNSGNWGKPERTPH